MVKNLHIAYFDLFPVRVSLMVPHREVLHLLTQVFHYFGWRSVDASVITDASQTIRFYGSHRLQDKPQIPAQAQLVLENYGVRFYRQNHLVFAQWETSQLVVDTALDVVYAYLPLAQWGSLTRLSVSHLVMVMHGLLMLVRKRGLFPMHAAAVSNGETGFLLPAPGGQGKTTITLGLIEAGWRYLSDDSVLLVQQEDEVGMRPLRRTFAFTENALQRVKEAVSLPQVKHEKWHVDIRKAFPAQAVERAIPRVLVLPEISDTTQSTLVPISKLEALHQVLEQSALISLPSSLAQRHMQCISQLLRQCQCYRLEAGQDIYHEPRLAADFLSSISV